MPFRFRLKPLLNHREFKLREARSAAAAAEKQRLEIVSRIELLQAKARLETEQFEQEQEKGISASRYIIFKNYMSTLDRELLQLKAELAKASREVERRQQVVVECNKAVKLLENIETREKLEYNFMQLRKEQKVLDETAVLKDYRDRNSGRKREEEE